MPITSICEANLGNPGLIANEEGVLLRVGRQKQPSARFKYVAPGAEPVVYDLGPNASPLACASPGDLVLFRTNLGEVERLQLVHGKTGESIWDIESPVRPYPNAATSAIVADDKVFVLGRDVAAIDLKSGRVLIRWESTDPLPRLARFFRRGNDVFIVTDKEFYRLNLSNLNANHERFGGSRF